MMNILTLSLVFTSILTAGIFSSAADSSITQNRGAPHDDVIVKEGHRVVVVEYENRKEGDHGNTKILVSPPETRVSLENSEDGSVSGSASTAKELICDAFGMCKEKIASVVRKSKDKVVETSQIASDQIHNMNGKISESVSGITQKASDKVHDVRDKSEEAAHEASDKVHDVVKDAKDKVIETDVDTRTASAKLYDAAKDAKGTVKEKAKAAADKVKDAAGKIPGIASFAAKDTVATSENLGLDVKRNLTGFMENPVEKAAEGVDRLKDEINLAKEGGRVSNFKTGMVKLILAVVHMLGFSMAFGTCCWVTFASSYIMARYVPTQQYGMVQSKLYGFYFRAMAVSVATALVSYFLGHLGNLWTSRLLMFQGWNLLVSLITVLINLLYLGPQSTKVMFERMKLEQDVGKGSGRDGLNIAEPSSRSISNSQPDRGPVKEGESQEESETKVKSVRMFERLKKLNTYSSFLNIATLMSLSWHLVYLAQTLNRATF